MHVQITLFSGSKTWALVIEWNHQIGVPSIIQCENDTPMQPNGDGIHYFPIWLPVTFPSANAQARAKSDDVVTSSTLNIKDRNNSIHARLLHQSR